MRYARLAVGTAVLLAACAVEPAATPSTPSLSTSPSPPPTAPVSTSPLPVATSPPIPSPTTPTPVPTLVFTEQRFEGNPVAILADTDGWVAVGASEAGAPTAWTSSDAVTWTPHPVPDPNPQLREQDGFVGSVLGPIAKWGDIWFSFGTVIGCCDGRGVLAWRSTDGRTWEVIESESPLFTDGFYVQQLLAHDDGLVARETGYAQYSSRVWTWTPEESWVASDLGGLARIEYEGIRVWLTGLAWDGERFIAVGGPLRGDHDAPPTGGVWVSSDARRWEAVEEPSMAGVAFDSVAAAPGGGFLAVGRQDGVLAAWGSADGRTWEARSLPQDDGLAANHVFEAGDVLLAVGFGDDRTAVWMSGDGIAWGAPAFLRPLRVTSVAAGTADHVVIIGHERMPDGSGSAILFRASLGE